MILQPMRLPWLALCDPGNAVTSETIQSTMHDPHLCAEERAKLARDKEQKGDAGAKLPGRSLHQREASSGHSDRSNSSQRRGLEDSGRPRRRLGLPPSEDWRCGLLHGPRRVLELAEMQSSRTVRI